MSLHTDIFTNALLISRMRRVQWRGNQWFSLLFSRLGLEMLIAISSAFSNKQPSKSSAYSVLICTNAPSPGEKK